MKINNQINEKSLKNLLVVQKFKWEVEEENRVGLLQVVDGGGR